MTVRPASSPKDVGPVDDRSDTTQGGNLILIDEVALTVPPQCSRIACHAFDEPEGARHPSAESDLGESPESQSCWPQKMA